MSRAGRELNDALAFQILDDHRYCGDPGGACRPRAGGKARRAGDRQQRLPERSKTAEGGQRRPHHGRYAEAARLYRDGRGEPDAGRFQPDAAGVRQGGRARRHRVLLLCRPWLRDRRAEFFASDRRAARDRGAGRTGARRFGSRRPHHRAHAEQEGAHRYPGVRCLPQQSVRTPGHPCGCRWRRPRADDAIARRRVLDLFSGPPADRARSSLQQ